MFRRKKLLFNVDDRKSFIENSLCSLMTELYKDISQLQYSQSHRRRERVTVICRTNTQNFHRRQYNVIDITGKDIYEVVTLITNKVRQLHQTNSSNNKGERK